MSNVAVVVGVLAMFVALGAVFFASLAMKKVDEAAQAVLRAHVEPLAAELAEIKGTLNKTKRLAETQQTEFATLKELKQDLSTTLRDLEVRLNALKEAEPSKPARTSWQS